jgi:SRSO17 transposase
MVERALDAGMPAGWVAADEAYGQDGKFRLGLQKRQVGYALAVPRSQKIPTDGGAAPRGRAGRRGTGAGVEAAQLR